jgi:sulfonate transport system ATP-binding protein
MSPAVEFDQITCTFAGTRGSYTAVKDASLAVAAGEFVSVVGPTGCGKSTLLNVAAGLLRPTSGTVRVFGEPLAGINRKAGYMFQSEALMPWRNALRNVTAGLEFRGVALEEARRRGEDWLERVGLAGFGDRYPY